MGKISISEYTIATLGSHSALQILKGAKDEGFKTLIITTHNRQDFYRRFKFIDKILSVKDFSEYQKIEDQLKDEDVILIPHGSFVAYLGTENNKKISAHYFGNKAVLDWEADRGMQREWLAKAGINVPRQFDDIEDVTFPVIVKTYGAAGGKGYFYARDKADFKKKIKAFKSEQYVIQEYIIGVTLYVAYFYSPITNEIEVMSMDRRYETNVDSLGRIPLHGQQGLDIEPSYVVVGNQPLIIRESLLPEVYAMGERVVETSKKLMGGKGLFGPFCLEMVITPDQRMFVIEISGRIVAGTSLYVGGSPYADLNYDVPMSTGRRIAREIKTAVEKGELEKVLD